VDVHQDVIYTQQHVMAPVARDSHPETSEDSGSLKIISPAIDVLSTIDLHDELRFEADEVDDVALDRILAPELEATHSPITQMPPKLRFGVRLRPSQ
jgi:hypothetical protein